MGKPPRAFRVAENLREVIATELLSCADPRLELVSITSVTISPDLREANVYWTVHDSNSRKDSTTEGLSASENKFKKAISKKLDLRFIPNLRFFYDNTFDTIDEVDKLMEKIAECIFGGN